jgi:hypothetical protein
MKTALIVAASILGCLLAGGRLSAETEPQSPSAPDPVTPPPAGIIVTPPVSIPLKPDILPPNSPPQTCPATDHKLDLIG